MKDFKGYVALYRKLLESPIFKNQNTLQVAIYCLLKATHKAHTQTVGDQVVKLEAGQLVTGRKKMAQDCNLSEQSVRTTMRNLEKLDFLTIKSTNKFSVVTVLNWNDYQLTNQQTTSSLTTNNNTNNNNKKKAKASLDYSTIENLNQEAWDQWLKFRKLIKQPAYKTLIKAKELATLDHDKQLECVKYSMSNEYKGLFPERLKGNSHEKGTGHSGKSAATRTAENIQKEFGSGATS